MGGRASDHILLVEDDPEARDEMAWVLRREGYAVVVAADGEEALEAVRREMPALILLDLMMPVMDGFEFRVRQMQDPALAEIPIIVLSGGWDLQRKAAALGATACLQKPVDPSRLLEMVGASGMAPAARGRAGDARAPEGA
jgi:two-component system, chemotaxis family, chemotaxis protein CheY